MKWEPIARVKALVGWTTDRFHSRPRYEILAITLGPKRQLRCGCTRTWTLLPEEIELPEDADTCIHIKLLYANGMVPISIRRLARGTVYLAPRGKELFGWRYSALALK